jgi:hypothetical protein
VERFQETADTNIDTDLPLEPALNSMDEWLSDQTDIQSLLLLLSIEPIAQAS